MNWNVKTAKNLKKKGFDFCMIHISFEEIEAKYENQSV